MGNAVVRRELWDEIWCETKQRIPHSAHPTLIFVCRTKLTSVCLPLERMAEHPPFLKIGCAERGLKIDPPLITVSLKYLSATATFKHHSRSLGFYNPYTISVLVMVIPTISFICFGFIWLLFSLSSYSSSRSKRIKEIKCFQLTWLFYFICLLFLLFFP